MTGRGLKKWADGTGERAGLCELGAHAVQAAQYTPRHATPQVERHGTGGRLQRLAAALLRTSAAPLLPLLPRLKRAPPAVLQPAQNAEGCRRSHSQLQPGADNEALLRGAASLGRQEGRHARRRRQPTARGKGAERQTQRILGVPAGSKTLGRNGCAARLCGSPRHPAVRGGSQPVAAGAMRSLRTAQRTHRPRPSTSCSAASGSSTPGDSSTRAHMRGPLSSVVPAIAPMSRAEAGSMRRA